MQKQKIRIRLKAFDYKLIDQSALEIVDRRPATTERKPEAPEEPTRAPQPQQAEAVPEPGIRQVAG